jgi:penicillin-binding protein-related factor A (putative recombinase)
MNQQLELIQGGRPTPHANRGREFQTILNNTHDWYNRQRWGHFYEIPNAYAFVNEFRWRNAPVELRARTEIYFIDRNGRKEQRGGLPLLRVKSGPDYLGGIGSLHVEFDAKEFSEASIPVKQFTEHQVQKLYDAERAGAIAGFMVLEKRTSNVYWVTAQYTREWLDQARMRRDVAKSLNFSKIVDERVRLVCQVERDSMAHYAPALIPSFKERLIKSA